MFVQTPTSYRELQCFLCFRVMFSFVICLELVFFFFYFYVLKVFNTSPVSLFCRWTSCLAICLGCCLFQAYVFGIFDKHKCLIYMYSGLGLFCLFVSLLYVYVHLLVLYCFYAYGSVRHIKI